MKNQIIWSRSIREEIVGVLWLILATLLYTAHANILLIIVSSVHGSMTEITAIWFAWQEVKGKDKHEEEK